VSLLDVSTSLSLDHSTLSVVAINRSASDHLVTKLSLDANVEALPHRARMLTIGADVGDLFATNSISQPDTVVLGDEQEVRLDHGRYAFPAHSITALTFDLR
jgi:alpha-N-arabinofuranosidase